MRSPVVLSSVMVEPATVFDASTLVDTFMSKSRLRKVRAAGSERRTTKEGYGL